MAGDLSLRSPALGAKGRRLAVMAPPAGHRRYCGPRGAHATGRGRPSPPPGGHRGRHAARGQRPDGHWRQGQGAGGTPCIASQIPNSASRQCIPVDKLEVLILSLSLPALLGLAMYHVSSVCRTNWCCHACYSLLIEVCLYEFIGCYFDMHVLYLLWLWLKGIIFIVSLLTQ